MKEKKCPLAILSNQLTQLSRKFSNKKQQTESQQKHIEYLTILKKNFTENDKYFSEIEKHITAEDLFQFSQIKNPPEAIQFLNQKMKHLFWSKIEFPAKKETMREKNFFNIGNLGIDDVTNLLEQKLFIEQTSIEETLLMLDKEILLRLKNNMLIDSVLHLKNFQNIFISHETQKHSKKIETILDQNFNQDSNKFSTEIIPQDFQTAMKKDSLIINNEFIPQKTFGCPIVNLQSGQLFRTFVQNFLRKFLTSHNPFY